MARNHSQKRQEANHSGQKPVQHTVRQQTHTVSNRLNIWSGSKAKRPEHKQQNQEATQYGQKSFKHMVTNRAREQNTQPETVNRQKLKKIEQETFQFYHLHPGCCSFHISRVFFSFLFNKLLLQFLNSCTQALPFYSNVLPGFITVQLEAS